MSTTCVLDLTHAADSDGVTSECGLSLFDIDILTVDDVMARALVMTTGTLLSIYAVDAFLAGREPNWMQVELYLTGTEKVPPLDFRTFPRLLSDLTLVKKEVIGSKMSDSTGMLLALLVMASNPEQAAFINKQLREPAELLDENLRTKAMMGLCAGEGPQQLVNRFFEGAGLPYDDGADDVIDGKRRFASIASTSLESYADLGCKRQPVGLVKEQPISELQRQESPQLAVDRQWNSRLAREPLECIPHRVHPTRLPAWTIL